MTEQQQPRIGVIGTGAIGGFYGLMLARAGFDVHFLLRSEYDAVSRHGLRINSTVHGELHLPKVQAYNDVAQMPQCDWLLVGAKTTSNADLAPIINQAAAPNAKILLLQNGFAVEEQLRPLLDAHLHLLGGLCFICVHRSAPGVIEHQAQGGVNLGYHSGSVSAEEGYAIAQQGAALFQQAGLDSKAMAQLQEARWQKLVWNIPYNGLSVLLNSNTAQLMGEPHSRELIVDLMNEVIAGAAACGYPLPDTLVAGMLKVTDAMPAYLPSMHHDFTQQRPMELQAVYRAPLEAAQAAGCAMPKVKMLLQTLEYLSA
ncbi:putative 2-dehydropantoate 2-reductase [Pseudomonas sp. C27(2019)]|uniref:putative 2-dehydropantoate 2-reductase n=1 Tax=Pseudomonas sp. C27(2019) TaxID=2604941 RepID=UPI001244D826|nr:putative 2-dehydropantoate 2-reductase [Pseudomonas sp. C27(2019)]QEY59050.1 putative 2-dehydropantoate 2-reductase [Pseudomonas sp. C27(2019)]